jgi:thiol:disulfide interchange protein DsbD
MPLNKQSQKRIGMRTNYLKVLSFLLALVFALTLPSQIALCFDDLEPSGDVDLDLHPTDVIHWTGIQAVVNANDTVSVGLRLTTSRNFSIYKEKLQFIPPDGWQLESIQAPESFSQVDPLNEPATVEVFRAGDFELIFRGLEPLAASTFNFGVKFLGCTSSICLFPYTQQIELPAYKANLASEIIEPNGSQDTIDIAGESSPEPADNDKASELEFSVDSYANALESGQLPMALLLIVVFIGGMITNLTPCVFPMIPITLRILSHRKGSPLLNAVVYSLGIVITYTAIGSIVALSGGVFGAVLGNPIVTTLFGLMFTVLAFSMLGYGNFSQLQAMGSKIGGSNNSALSTLAMGTAAGLVAAPCTGPILGALIIYAAQLSEPSLTVFLFLVYSIGFALPYVFLGSASAKITRISVSPRVQVGIKFLFASIMFALALFYLKTPIHKSLEFLRGWWFTTSVALISIGLLACLGVLFSTSASQNKAASILPSLVLGLGLFAGSQWATGGDIPKKLDWLTSEKEAFALAASENKSILVDGWADWCVACKEMDTKTFTDPELIEELKQNWVLLKLDLTELNEQNEALAKKYNMPGLPTLVLIKPDGDISQGKRLTSFVSAEKLLEEINSFDKE